MKYLPRIKGILTFISCMWIMTMNQHEGTYSAATRMTYRCKIAWLYFRLDYRSNLTESRISLIFFFFINFFYFFYCVRPLYTSTSRQPPTDGQYGRGAGLSTHSNTHDTHTIEGEHGPWNSPSLSKLTPTKCCFSNTKTIAQRWKQTPSQLLFFFK